MKVTGKPPGVDAAKLFAQQAEQVTPIVETQSPEAMDPRKEGDRKGPVFPEIDPEISKMPALKGLLQPK